MTPKRTGPNWRTIPGFESRYQINTQGDVLDLREGRFLRRIKIAEGYRVGLRKGNRRILVMVQRALLMSFYPVAKDRQWVAECQTDDVFDTQLENWAWKRNQMRVKLTESDVLTIRARIASDPRLTYPMLAEEYHVSESAIKHINLRHSWDWLK